MPALAHHGGQVPLQYLSPNLGSTLSSSYFLPSPTSAVRDTLNAPDATPTFHTTPSTDYSELDSDFSDSDRPTVIEILPSLPAISSETQHIEGDTQMLAGKKWPIPIVSTFLSLFTVSQVYQHNHSTNSSEGREEVAWIASSHSWLDRKACQWFGVCGLAHLNKSKWTWRDYGKRKEQEAFVNIDASSFWESGKSRPEDWTDDERVLREVPKYVLDYAPLIHLYSGEEFWPCDIVEHLIHTTPHLNYTPLQAADNHPNLDNLGDLNEWGRFVYLQSDDNVEERPEWLGGEANIPDTPDHPEEGEGETSPDEDGDDDGDSFEDIDDWWEVGYGSTRDKGGVRPNPAAPQAPVPTVTDEGEELYDGGLFDSELLKRSKKDWQLGKKIEGGRSDAPAVLVVVDKGHGVVDAFWFFFYSYNLGNVVLNVRFGNHVGDWEHTVIRFKNGKPKAIFFSEHNFGEAYSYAAVEKVGKRPVGFSATGTHAMYATPGTHPYVLPLGLLHDVTDRGPLWDPLQNMHAYTYDYLNDTLRSSQVTPKAPTNWFYFIGHWGDKFYPLSDPRQYRFAGQYHYVNGPLGPRFKNLGRKTVCQSSGQCIIKNWIGGSNKVRRWQGVGEGEEMSEEDRRRFIGPALPST